ncbi:MAG TPA: DUF47 family protein [Symbiobacteriaceae bacterium]
MAFNFLPREEQFFLLFEEAAGNVGEGAEVLHQLLSEFRDPGEAADRLRVIEERGDEITYQIIARLNRAIITPIEREDIFTIARRLDDVVDFLDAAVSRVVAYGVSETTPAARQFAELIRQAAGELKQLFALLHRRDHGQIRQPKAAINAVESEADRLLRQAVAELFAGGYDPLTVIKWKEIYETLEEITDRMEGLANLVEGVILKNT